MSRARLISVIGTRPEAIKMAPVALAAAARHDVEHILVATGQHGALFDDALAAFGLRPDRTLTVVGDGTLDGMMTAIHAAVRALVDAERPDMLLVQGDTTTACAAALGAHDAGVAVGHVEAGLRSFDLAHPWPEERNRVAIDAIAALLFAPTPEAAANLALEPAAHGGVLITGNTGIDALVLMRARLRAGTMTAALPPGWLAARHPILATSHRRESIGRGITEICAGLAALADRPDVAVLLPLHGNPAVRDPIEAALGRHPAVHLIPALPYPAMVAAMDAAYLILSDSGGVQEEAPALGTPALVLRDVTERPEGIGSGNLRLVGTDRQRIVAAATALLDDPAEYATMATPAFPFGDGHAADKILDACVEYVAARRAGATDLLSGG